MSFLDTIPGHATGLTTDDLLACIGKYIDYIHVELTMVLNRGADNFATIPVLVVTVCTSLDIFQCKFLLTAGLSSKIRITNKYQPSYDRMHGTTVNMVYVDPK